MDHDATVDLTCQDATVDCVLRTQQERLQASRQSRSNTTGEITGDHAAGDCNKLQSMVASLVRTQGERVVLRLSGVAACRHEGSREKVPAFYI